jgi:hypothetical protein
MFDSLNGGYFPICVVVIVAAWFVSSFRSWWWRVFLGIAMPIVISLCWFFVPRLSILFKPLQFGEDDWVSWGYIAAGTWSMVAVPLSVLTIVVFSYFRRRRNIKEDGT